MPPPIPAILAALRDEAARQGHELPPPADDARIAEIERLAGFALPSAYAALLRWSDGAGLFAGRRLRFLDAPSGRLPMATVFEWTRGEFRQWAAAVAEGNGYRVRFLPVGGDDPEVGPPTQMAIFDKLTGVTADDITAVDIAAVEIAAEDIAADDFTADREVTA